MIFAGTESEWMRNESLETIKYAKATGNSLLQIAYKGYEISMERLLLEPQSTPHLKSRKKGETTKRSKNA